MDKLGLKATLYDIFGYFLPGLLLIIQGRIVYLSLSGTPNFQDVATFVTSQSIYQFIFILIMSYIIGHLSSTASYFFIENLFFRKNQTLNNQFSAGELLPEKTFQKFCTKYTEQFGINFNMNDFTLVASLVECKTPALYSTAFIFLSFYGMLRSCAFLFFTAFILEHGLALYTGVYPCHSLGYLPIGWLSLYGYIRFRKYYIKKIVYSFLLLE